MNDSLLKRKHFIFTKLDQKFRHKTTNYRKYVYRSDSCDIDNTNTLPFQIIFAAGGFFTIISAFISFYLDKIGPRILVRKFYLIKTL